MWAVPSLNDSALCPLSTLRWVSRFRVAFADNARITEEPPVVQPNQAESGRDHPEPWEPYY